MVWSQWGALLPSSDSSLVILVWYGRGKVLLGLADWLELESHPGWSGMVRYGQEWLRSLLEAAGPGVQLGVVFLNSKISYITWVIRV